MFIESVTFVAFSLPIWSLDGCRINYIHRYILLQINKWKKINNLSLSLKGKYHEDLVSFVKNDEIRPSISCQIILERREERNRLNS